MYEVDNEIDEEKETLKGILLQRKLSLQPTSQSFKRLIRRCLAIGTKNSCYNNM